LASKSTKSARASYKLVILNQLPGGTDEVFVSSGVRLFEAKGVQIDGWGRDKFMLASTVNDPDNGFVVDDIITFKVEITVYGELEASAPIVTTAFLNTVPTLSKNLKDLIDDETHSDVTLILYSGCNPKPKRSSKAWSSKPSFKIPCHSKSETKDDTQQSDTICDVGTQVKVSAHRCILVARSPVFDAMFRSGMSETSGIVEIDDIDVHVMKALLEFIYSDTIDPKLLESYAELLLIAAAKYQVLGLVSICESYLCIHITTETALTLLKLADDIPDCEKLRRSCLQYIAQHPSDWNNQEEFETLDYHLLKEVQTIIDNSIKKNNRRFSFLGDSEKRISSFCSIQ
jgi:hypothetical protein